jgi:hypothetical protein
VRSWRRRWEGRLLHAVKVAGGFSAQFFRLSIGRSGRTQRETLTTIGLAAPQFEVGVSERDILIRLKDAARTDAVKAALLGMPIRYSIQSGEI